MTTTTVEYIDLEAVPFVDRTRYTTGEGVATTEVSDEYTALPAPFVDALTGLLTQQDNTRCARCADPVGFVVRVQSSGSDGLEWTPCGLARDVDHPEHVVVLCELCTPFVPKPEDGTQ